MPKFLKFHWLCVKHAWRGCWTRANELAAVLGGGILWLVLYWLSPWLRTRELIEAPSTLWGATGFAVASAAASVILAFAVIFAGRLMLSPVRLYWTERERADGLDQELEAARVRQDGVDTGPDWPIHELFSHIQPDLLDNANEAAWERIGDDLRDDFSIGRLRVWGRPVQDGIGKMLGERPALRLIDSPYWHSAHFTYTFFDETAEDAPHTYTDKHSGLPEYTDLRVSRAEALKLWPGEPSDIAETYPNIRVADSPPVLELFNGSERTKLIALLVAEKLSSWARVSASTYHDHVRLEGTIWNTHAMMFLSKTTDPGTINQTYLRPKGTHNSTHYDVCLNYAQLKRAWPALSVRRTKCDIM